MISTCIQSERNTKYQNTSMYRKLGNIRTGELDKPTCFQDYFNYSYFIGFVFKFVLFLSILLPHPQPYLNSYLLSNLFQIKIKFIISAQLFDLFVQVVPELYEITKLQRYNYPGLSSSQSCSLKCDLLLCTFSMCMCYL